MSQGGRGARLFLGCQRHLAGHCLLRPRRAPTPLSHPRSRFFTLPARTHGQQSSPAGGSPGAAAVNAPEPATSPRHCHRRPRGTSSGPDSPFASGRSAPASLALAEALHCRDRFDVCFAFVVVAFPIGYGSTGATRRLRAVGPSGSVAACDKCPAHASEEGRARSVRKEITLISAQLLLGGHGPADEPVPFATVRW